MPSLNKCSFIGNLGRDVEVRNLPDGSKVASFSLAVTERFKDKSGSQREDTQWIPCTLFRRQAEIAEQYLKKGSCIYVDGKWKTDSWEKDGQKHFKTGLVVSSFQMLGSKGGSSETQAGQQAQGQSHNDVPPPYEDSLPF